MNDYETERQRHLLYGQASPADACREYAWNAGIDRPNQPWILTDYDVWMPNPHFVGHRGPHPEEEQCETDFSGFEIFVDDSPEEDWS